MDFYYDQETGQRVWYGKSRQRPIRAGRSPRPVRSEVPTGRQPTAQEPRALGAVVKTAIIDSIMDQYPAICRQLVREAMCLGIEGAVNEAMGVRHGIVPVGVAPIRQHGRSAGEAERHSKGPSPREVTTAASITDRVAR
jgi:hypothetical protein